MKKSPAHTPPPKKEGKASPKGGFDPSKLSKEELEAAVEYYLGVHPRYFLYSGLNIKLNHGKFRHDGHHFNGWKPKSWKYNSLEE